MTDAIVAACNEFASYDLDVRIVCFRDDDAYPLRFLTGEYPK